MSESVPPAKTRRARPSLLDLAERVHRGELTPEEAVQIFELSEASATEDTSP